MRSPTQPKKVLTRGGLVLTSLLAMVASDTVAWGHGATTGGSDRVHTCLRGSSRRIPRVVTVSEACTNAETGLDLPHNGTFIGTDIGAPVSTAITGAAVGTSTGPITVACTPDPAPPDPPIHRAVGVTVSQSSDLALTVSRPAGPTAWEVVLVAVTAGNKSATVAPICMRLFQQLS